MRKEKDAPERVVEYNPRYNLVIKQDKVAEKRA